MKPRDYVIKQLAHEETFPVPYTVGFEGDVVERLNTHYGSPSWRDRMEPYIRVIAEPDMLNAVPTWGWRMRLSIRSPRSRSTKICSICSRSSLSQQQNCAVTSLPTRSSLALQTAKPLQPDTPTENATAVIDAFTNQKR